MLYLKNTLNFSLAMGSVYAIGDGKDIVTLLILDLTGTFCLHHLKRHQSYCLELTSDILVISS